MVNDPWFLLAGVLTIGGLIGAVLPVVPGPPLILLGALVYDFGHDWQAFGPVWLAVLLLLTIVATGADWIIGGIGARRGGASWLAVVTGFFTGLIGLVIFSLPGLVLGTLAGVVGVEYVRGRQGGRALRAGGGWLIGYLVSMVVELGVAIVMTGVMIWRMG